MPACFLVFSGLFSSCAQSFLNGSSLPTGAPSSKSRVRSTRDRPLSDMCRSCSANPLMINFSLPAICSHGASAGSAGIQSRGGVISMLIERYLIDLLEEIGKLLVAVKEKGNHEQVKSRRQSAKV
jgi:hypothetical protein